MGGRKFKLSNMIPIAWFYKLKNLNKSMNQNPNHSKPNKHHSSSSSSSSSLIVTNSSHSSGLSLSSSTSSSLSVVPQQTHLSLNRTSQYFKRDLITSLPSKSSDTQSMDSPRKFSRRRRINRRNRVSSPRRKNPVAPTDDDKSLILKDSNFGKLLNVELPPIVTKKVEIKKTQVGISSENVMNWSVRRLSVSSPKMKEQGKKMKKKKDRRSGSRLSGSFAVVKSSVNPKKDFMESMVEMIVENEIEGSKDLEDLLVCYLQLNSDEYHELIIAVFKQIWFSVADNRLKMKKK
ncbi:transcription repressor OFP1-like [Impatiens glandulifera]|uniref:transcription repressor OFP1-like n=1 Tax=Impatiens glandulifera TaxID=253017 RepID=UPI001FB06C4A|nr:transcription repressor OFP1-like [Impatiens glandulifera]